MSDTDRTIRLHLSNGASLDLTVEAPDLDETLQQLTEVSVNPSGLFTFERQEGGVMHVPSPSLLLFELLPA